MDIGKPKLASWSFISFVIFKVNLAPILEKNRSKLKAVKHCTHAEARIFLYYKLFSNAFTIVLFLTSILFRKIKIKKYFEKKVSLSSPQEFWVKKIVNLSEKVIILTWDKSRDAKLKEIPRHLNNLLTALLTPWQLLIWLNCSQFSSVLQIHFRLKGFQQGVCREVTRWAYWIWEVIFLFCFKNDFLGLTVLVIFVIIVEL